ncbi:hypothetical protein AAG570_005109 [Ranatra chinensis]|uniref:Uncharacterized protein n=1 Tax=Ranatra chinensis TaxID=642074 RepID=A0ABD0Y0E2_9HEMI
MALGICHPFVNALFERDFAQGKHQLDDLQSWCKRWSSIPFSAPKPTHCERMLPDNGPMITKFRVCLERSPPAGDDDNARNTQRDMGGTSDLSDCGNIEVGMKSVVRNVPGCVEDSTKGFGLERLDSVNIKLSGWAPQLYTVCPGFEGWTLHDRAEASGSGGFMDSGNVEVMMDLVGNIPGGIEDGTDDF